MSLSLKPMIAISLILGGFFLGSVHADVYIWTDEKGIRHYSNISPPQNRDITSIEEKIELLPSGELFKAVKVYDGDTLEAMGSGLRFKIRLVGIDTPEAGRKGQKGQPFAEEAKQALSNLILNKKIRIKQYGTGGYNRILAEVFIGSLNINLSMLKKGLAEVYMGKPASNLDILPYRKTQAIAVKNRTGIWSLGSDYQSPRQWRKENPRK